MNRVLLAVLMAALSVGLIWAVDLIWASRSGILLVRAGTTLATLLALGANIAVYASLNARYGAGDRATELALGFAIFVALGAGATLLSYLAATLASPFADPWLARADAALGFDWPAWNGFVKAHPLFQRLLRIAYVSMQIQVVLLLFVLPLSGRGGRNLEFIATMGVSLLPTIALSGLFPAESAWIHHRALGDEGLAYLAHLKALREGSMTTIDLRGLTGLITFPSYHSVMAVLLAYAARGTFLSFLSLVLNALMLVSVPTEGGHYLTDAIAGIAIAVASIVLVRFAARWLARRNVLRQTPLIVPISASE